MTTGDGAFLRTYLQEAQRDTDELASITEKTPRFLQDISRASIEKIFPRQGLLNDRHTERLLEQIRMTHLGQPLGSATPPPATTTATTMTTTTTQALPMVEVEKSVETVVVPMTPEKHEKRVTAAADSDEDVDDKPKKPADTSTKKSHGSTSDDDDDDTDDNDEKPETAENGFDEELEKHATSKTEHREEKTTRRTQKSRDSASESKSDSVDLEIESADDDDNESDSDDDDESGTDKNVIEDDDSQNSDEVRGNEVMARLRRTEGEALAKKLKKTVREIERGVKELTQQDGSDDDDEEFKGNDEDDDGRSTGESNSAASGGDDADDSERPRKKAKKMLSKDAAPKKSALMSKEKSNGKSAKSVRIAGEADDDDDGGGGAPTEQPKKKKKLAVRMSELSKEEKKIVEEQAERSAQRRAKKGNWMAADVLKDVVTVACKNLFLRDFNAKNGRPQQSMFTILRGDNSDDKIVRRLKKSLYIVKDAIAETMSVVERPGNEVMQTLTDFVERTTEIRACPLQVTNSDEPVRCDLFGTFFEAANMEQLTAFKSKKPGEITQNIVVASCDLHDLVDAVAFLKNFEMRAEEMVKARLVKISTYVDGKTTAAEAVKLLRDDPVNKPAHVLLSTRLRVALETVDRSMRIIKSAEDKELKKTK